ncbi:hypothetical protein OAN96_01315 [Candidatus Gracilibacteria bacterium]|nr:hypothetical protein [Candidatus Gracilibacteria bacterium]
MSFKNETVAETKQCQKCQVSFDITDKDIEFYDKVSPVFDGKKYNFPKPSLCPVCRDTRRLAFRNERTLYKTKCGSSGKDMISLYSPESPVVVYDQSIWWSDDWEPLDYGRDFDFSRPFFEQFQELIHVVPRCNLINDYVKQENSPFVNLAGPTKNSHFIFETDRCEKCLFSYTLYDCTSCVDCNNIDSSTGCYESVNINNGYNLSYCKSCDDCRDCIACIGCSNCEYCYGCSGLVGAKYQIKNKQYGKEQYFEEIKKLDPSSQYLDIYKGAIHESMAGVGNSGEISGDNINHSENTLCSFDVSHTRDCKYCMIINNAQDCMDYSSWGEHSSQIYECHNSGDRLSQSSFCNFVWGNCDHVLYSDLCTQNNSHLFGCVGLKNKKYCILNKQYGKEEYEVLVPRIIKKMQEDKQWGEFFPSSISPFGYNETAVQDYFPLDKNQAIEQGFHWSDYQAAALNVEKTIPANKLPDNIADIPDDILNWAIVCEVTQKPFKITSQELDFYRKRNISIPTRHPDQRHSDRMALRNPRKLFERDCDKCGTNMQTTYAPDRSEKVYCEDCYNSEIY